MIIGTIAIPHIYNGVKVRPSFSPCCFRGHDVLLEATGTVRCCTPIFAPACAPVLRRRLLGDPACADDIRLHPRSGTT